MSWRGGCRMKTGGDRLRNVPYQENEIKIPDFSMFLDATRKNKFLVLYTYCLNSGTKV
jgi:hypothetical protein